MEDIVGTLTKPVSAADLCALVRAGHDNDMDLAHLLLHVEMPPVVGDYSLGEYAREVCETYETLEALRAGDATAVDALREDHRHVPRERLVDGEVERLTILLDDLLELGAAVLSQP